MGKVATRTGCDLNHFAHDKMQNERRIDISVSLIHLLAFVNGSLLLQIGSLSAVAAVEPRMRHLEGGTIRQGLQRALQGIISTLMQFSPWLRQNKVIICSTVGSFLGGSGRNG
jgi:hypothetical protein